jgi:hypothetical protein
MVVVAALLFAIALLTGCDTLSPVPSTLTPTPTVIVVAATPPTLVPTFAPSPTPVPAVESPTMLPAPTATPMPEVLVVSADGDGVFIRIVPEKTDRYKAWADVTSMLVVGADRMVNGRLWKNVRDPDGNIGWIPNQYLKPPPTSTPTG